MKIRDAILTGAARVDGRTKGNWLTHPADGTDAVRACAIGAVFLACHPDIDPARYLDDEHYRRQQGTITSWMGHVMENGEGLDMALTRVMDVNDSSVSGTTWDDLLEALSERHPNVLEMEVCDEPA